MAAIPDENRLVSADWLVQQPAVTKEAKGNKISQQAPELLQFLIACPVLLIYKVKGPWEVCMYLWNRTQAWSLIP